jgi:WS/DGAT/MGAT family acyltransferase
MTHEPLTPADADILARESRLVAGHILVLLLVDRTPGDTGPVADRVAERITRRLGMVPRCRQRIRSSRLHAGPPIWQDDPDFDVANHVSRADVDGVCDREQLRALVGAAMTARLDHERPLWHLDIVEQVEGDRWAVIARIHHAMADGTGATLMLATLLSDFHDSDAASESWAASPAPSDWSLAMTGVRGRASDFLSLARHGGEAAISPAAWRALTEDVERFGSSARRQLIPRPEQAPFSRAITRNREVAHLDRTLDDFKRAAHAHDEATINDVLLAAMAGALARWEPTRRAKLRHVGVKVPVSMHGGDDKEIGNVDSWMTVKLPVAHHDPVERLDRIASETRASKATEDPETLFRMIEFVGGVSRQAARALSDYESSSHLFAFEVSNLRGPNVVVNSFGGQITEVYPFVDIAQHHALRAQALSLSGRMFLALTADPTVLADLSALAGAIDEALDELLAALSA